MSKGGKAMDNHTKGMQQSEHINSTIDYREHSGPYGEKEYSAIVTSGGCDFRSQSYSNKDDARAEAAEMANSSLGFLYEEN
jgi:hypothetical protein